MWPKSFGWIISINKRRLSNNVRKKGKSATGLCGALLPYAEQILHKANHHLGDIILLNKTLQV